MVKKITIRYLCLAVVILGIGCSKDPGLSGTEVTNGNCVGKIYNSDGSAAENALVKLIPADYNPYTQTGESIDSTSTDENGNYGFIVSHPDYYNVVAEKGFTSCMRSVFIQADAKTVVDDDTLRESGSLSGVVRLKPGDDSRQVVILVLGTNVYTVPSDTSGNFETPLLPKGNYSIQLFTTLDGYAVFDTNVTVREGTRTQLAITLPSGDAPSVASLTASYDSATMFVSLSWPMPDTSKIVSLALYRNSSTGNDTMVIVDKSAMSYIDDMVCLDGDSVFYEIAGIGKNYREGYRTATKPIIVCGLVYCVKKFDMSRIVAGLDSVGYGDVFVDQEGQIFLARLYGIYKLDTNGVVRKDHRLDYNDRSEYWISSMQSDDRGHLYIKKVTGDTQMVVKFDADLNVIAQMPLDSGYGWFVAGSNGTIYAFYDVTDSVKGACTAIKEYDSTFTVIKEPRIINRCRYYPTRFGDTIVTLEYQPTDNQWSFHFYDTAFNLLSVNKSFDVTQSGWGNPRFGSQGGFIAAPNGIFVSIFGSVATRDESSLWLFTDNKGNLLGRIVVPETGGLSFDSRGILYYLTNIYPDAADMGWDNPPKTLYKYSMEPLLRKIGP